MKIRVGLAAPPHRDALVAEMNLLSDEGVDVAGEIFRANGKFMVCIYPEANGEYRELAVAELLGAIGEGMSLLENGANVFTDSSEATGTP